MRFTVSVVAAYVIVSANPAAAQRWGGSVAHTWSVVGESLNPWPAGSAVESYFARADFAGAVVYRRQLRSHLALQPELWVTTKGTGYRPNTSHETTLRYLALPITLRLGGGRPDRASTRGVVSIGLSPSVLLSCHWRPHGSANLACTDTASTISYGGEDRRAPRTDLGLLFGIGVEHRSPLNRVFGVDLRLDVGRRDLDGASPTLYRRNMQASVIATYIR